MSELWRRLRWLFRRAQFERELDEELQHHLSLKNEQPGQQIPFGNTALLKEESRSMWTFTFWEQFAQDIRYAARTMANNRLFTAMAALSLALGIGANTAIYSYMDAIMLRSLPVAHPEQLVIVNWRAGANPPILRSLSGSTYDDAGGGEVSPAHPYPAYELLRDHNQVLSGFFGHFGPRPVNVVIDGQAGMAGGEYVTGDFFSTLGVVPAAGRLIGRDDDRAGAPPVAIVTHDYWTSRLDANPAVIGKTIRINGAAFTLAGVSAPGFFGVEPDSKPSVFLPLANIGLTDSTRLNWPALMHEGTFYWIKLMGRLKPGVSLAKAQAQLAGPYRGLIQSTVTKERERNNLPALWLQQGGAGLDSLRRRYSKPLWVLMAMAGLILSVACANLANLLLARAATRRREMAVRLSLGAGRLRVIRQLLTESIMLALLGGVAGVGVGALGIRFLGLLLNSGASDFPLQASLDWRVLAFTLAIALVTGILFGLAPAVQSTRVDVTPALKESRASAVRTRTRRFGIPFGLSHILVVSQIAISLLLVAGAGLFVRTLANLHSVNLGFNSENILLFSLDAGRAGYGIQGKPLYLGLRQRFLAVPGVTGATMTSVPMVAGTSDGTDVSIPGIPKPPEGQRGPNTSYTQVGPSFFETMQIPILVGRALNERDVQSTQKAAVVNEVFAGKYFAGVNPLGRHFGFGGGKRLVDVEIVGVAKNARYHSLKQEIPPVTYLSFMQAADNDSAQEMYFELRTAGDPLALANTVRQIVHQAAPLVPMARVTTQSRRIDATILQERIFAQLCSCFGALALIMACVGLYGTMAYAVARRTSEIGIRMALGAERRRIVWMVLSEVFALSAAGLVIGFAMVWETTAFLKSFLFGMKPNDPAVLATSIAVLIVAAIVAGYAPAWRASRIDPMTALRHE